MSQNLFIGVIDESFLNKVQPNDAVVDHVQKHHIFPPSPSYIPYNFTLHQSTHKDHSDFHLSLFKILESYNQLNSSGFFVEAGALDGYFLSHTLDLEVKYNWTGLLVEAVPSKVRLLKNANRKSWVSDVCLSEFDNVTVDFVTKINKDKNWVTGDSRINPSENILNASDFAYSKSKYRSEGRVECYRLTTLLEAIAVRKVDLLVLDLQGYEFRILKTISFTEFDIKIIVIEHENVPEGSEVINEFMKLRGYKMIYYSHLDIVFVPHWW